MTNNTDRLPHDSGITRRAFIQRSGIIAGGLILFRASPAAKAGETDLDPTFRVYRNSDQVAVEFRFLNFEVVAGKLRPRGGQRSRIAMRFTAQQLAEAIFDQPDPNANGEFPPLTDNDNASAPVRTFLSGPSWLVFRYQDERGDLSVDPEDWLKLIGDPELSPLIVPDAVLNPTLVQDPISGRVTPIPPRTDETAIEVPFRLFIAPSVPTVILPAHQRGLGRRGGFNVLWHVALRSRVPIPPAAPPKDLPPEGLPPEIQPPKRVTLKARPFYSPDHMRGSEPKFNQYFPKDRQLSLHALTRHLLVEQIMGGDGIIDVERLELSAWGANASFYYASQRGIDEIEAQQMAQGEDGTGLAAGGMQQTHLYMWKHRIVVGRDVFFAEAFFGWLFPFQHPAIYVEVTERKFIEHAVPQQVDPSPPGAYLLKRRFIIRLRDLRRHLGSDSSLGREMALKQVRLITPQSPNLRDPAKKDAQGNSDQIPGAPGDKGLYFFPVDLNGRRVEWEIEAEDESQQKQRTTKAQLMFASHLRVGRKLYSGLSKADRSIPFPSVKIAFAPEAPVVRVPLEGGLLGIPLPGDHDLRKLAEFAGRRLLDQIRQKLPETAAERTAALRLIESTIESASAWPDAAKRQLLQELAGPLARLQSKLTDAAVTAEAWRKDLRQLLDHLTNPDVLQWHVEEAFKPLAEFVGKRVLEAAAVLENDVSKVRDAAKQALKAADEQVDRLVNEKDVVVRWTKNQVKDLGTDLNNVLDRLETQKENARSLAEEAASQLGKVRDLTSSLETQVMTFTSELLGRELKAVSTILDKVKGTNALSHDAFFSAFLNDKEIETWVDGLLTAEFRNEPSVRQRLAKRLQEARKAVLGADADPFKGMKERLSESVNSLVMADRKKLKAVVEAIESKANWAALNATLIVDAQIENLVITALSLAALDADAAAIVRSVRDARDQLRNRVDKLLEELDSARHQAEAIGTKALQAVMETADVIIPALKGVAADVPVKEIKLVGEYLAGSFEQAKNGAFAQLSQAIDEGKKLAKEVQNGLATPALVVAGISREIGVIAGQGKDAVEKFARKVRDINLDDAIPDAKLFGCLRLKDLLQPLLRGKLPDWKTLELPDRIERTFAWLTPLKKLDLAIVTFKPASACHLWLHIRTTILLRGQSPEGQVELIGWIGKWKADQGKVGEDGSQQDGRQRLTPPDESFVLNMLDLIEVGFSQIDLHASYRTSQGLKKPELKPTIGEIRFLGPLRFVQKIEEFLGDLFGGGFKLRFTGTHILVDLGFGFPPISFGVFSLRNINLWAGLGLPLGESPMRFNFALSSFEKPFELSIMGFAGRGFFSVGFDTSGDRLLKGALEFGGALSFDIAVASGGLYVMAGIYYEGRTGSMLLTAYIRAGGTLNVLGLIHVSVEFFLGLNYHEQGGQSELYGYCSITVSIEFCFWSMDVSVEMEKHLAGSSNSRSSQRTFARQPAALLPAAAAAQPGEDARPFIGGEAGRFETYDDFRKDYWSYFFPNAA